MKRSASFVFLAILCFGPACASHEPGPSDASTPESHPDASLEGVDAGPQWMDAGVDAGSDAGPADAGAFDAGPVDAGTFDAGGLDAGPVDAGTFDAGDLDAGVVDAGSDAGPDAGSFQPPAGTADYPAETEPNNVQAEANSLEAGTKGFTASIYPVGDVDVFELTITTPGTTILVATSDGMGGCPAGAQTALQIFDGTGQVLVQNDGTGGCVSFSSAQNAALWDLPPGNYFAQVQSATATTLPFYVIDLRVMAPVCGNSIVEVAAGEQCDHGASNGAPTDGCSATCQIKSGQYLNETEPNDTQAGGNDLDGYAGAVGQIAPVGDVDWYTVSVTTPGSWISAGIDDGFGACPSNFDSVLSLYAADGTLLATDTGGGVSPCSRIAPAVYAAAANLPVGQYALEVQRVSSAIQPSYVLEVAVSPPFCGDGVLPEGGKQCDPGPGVTNPGCSATCQLAGDFVPETEPNNTQATANPLGTHAGFIGAIEPVGDLDYFSFQVPGPESLVVIQTSDGIGGCPNGFDSVLTLYDPSGTLLVSDDNGGTGLCSLISPALFSQAMNLPGGTYRTRIEYKGDDTTFWQYVVSISVLQPGCGNGFVESGEQCDDGAANGTAGDGCSATCQSLAPWEIEPNNAMATATPQWPGWSTWDAHIDPVGDHDWFTFTLATTGTVTLTTHDVDQPTVCNFDTVLYLDDANGNQLASDDDSGPGPGDPTAGQCSQISMAGLPAGTYYAWVQRADDSEIIPMYQLDLAIQ